MTITVWEVAQIVWMVLSTAVTALVLWVSRSIATALRETRSEIEVQLQALRTEMAVARAKDREQLREWINGSFMRTKEVEARFDDLSHQIEHWHDARHNQK